MKKLMILIAAITVLAVSCKTKSTVNNNDSSQEFPKSITIEGIALNPEGIEYDRNDNTFLLSSLNAAPITKVNFNGTFKPFTSGEKFPLSTAGLQIDYKRNRLLVAGFNGTELMDNDPKTKGTAYLRIYNLKTGVIEKDINLSSLLHEANAYFANDIAIDSDGNAYISDWYARVIYKVDLDGNPSVFWSNDTGIPSGPNGLDFNEDGYLLVSILTVNEKGLYANYGLVKIPVDDPKSATLVNILNSGYTGFDGMLINSGGNIVGVTNSGTAPGGNTLIELSSNNDWKTAKVINKKSIPASTTVAITASDLYYVINQDFQNELAKDWTIEQIKF